MQKIDREAKITRARELFLSGYNCAQSVFVAYAEEAGLTESLALRLSSGFGGGMGGLRSVCGAVSGMFMVVSALRGYDDAADTEGKKRLYAREQAMAARFAEAYEVLDCRDLLKRNQIAASAAPSERTPEYYAKRPCARYVEACAGIVADELNGEAER